jgi:hypothetical protein
LGSDSECSRLFPHSRIGIGGSTCFSERFSVENFPSQTICARKRQIQWRSTSRDEAHYGATWGYTCAHWLVTHGSRSHNAQPIHRFVRASIHHISASSLDRSNHRVYIFRLRDIFRFYINVHIPCHRIPSNRCICDGK